MSLSQGSKIDWEDIKNIYTKLNTERSRFSFSTAAVPENQDQKLSPSNVTDLKNAVEEMTSHYRLTSVASTSEVSVPSSGELVKTDPFTKIDSIITNIQNTPTYGSNYGYCGSYNGTNYGYNGTNYGFNNSNNGYNNSNNEWYSGNYAYNASNNAWNSGNFSYNGSNNSSNYSWNSGNFSYNKSNK